MKTCSYCLSLALYLGKLVHVGGTVALGGVPEEVLECPELGVQAVVLGRLAVLGGVRLFRGVVVDVHGLDCKENFVKKILQLT